MAAPWGCPLPPPPCLQPPVVTETGRPRTQWTDWLIDLQTEFILELNWLNWSLSGKEWLKFLPDFVCLCDKANTTLL